jgi:aminomethyltransferase
VPPEAAVPIWDALIETGAGKGLLPAGLGARDTLRLEAAMALYGHELDDTTTPWEAGLSWVVKMEAGDFIGRDALAAQKEEGLERSLAGFEVVGRGIARQGHKVLVGGEEVGVVTSGTWSPTLERALGMAYVPVAVNRPGTEITLGVRGRMLDGVVVELPFYSRQK